MTHPAEKDVPHNHVTRDIKPRGQCPGCDRYHDRHSAEKDVLREAAQLMREEHGPEHQRHEMWQAMADWLEVGARRIEWHATNGGVPYVDDTYALAVARAYLGAPRDFPPGGSDA